jgi:hypothetical protein
MKRRLIAPLVVLAISFALPTFAQQTNTENGTANTSGVPLPFHSIIQGVAIPSFTGPCTFTNIQTGSGHAIHLGIITWSEQETVQFLSCPPPGTAIASTGNFKIVAANGDEIDGELQATGTLDPINGVNVQGLCKFLTGTGRFSNVAGSGVLAAHGPPTGPPFDFVGSMDGTIRY